MRDHEIFINYINDHYDLLRNKYRKFCQEKHYEWDEDIFSDTIIKCYDAIERKGSLNDVSDQGIQDYFFRSFKQNVQREKQYCRVAKRDFNLSSDEVEMLYEEQYNRLNDSSTQKLKNDLYVDFATLYIMRKVEEHWDGEHFYLFKLKTLCNLTYKELQEKSHMKGCRQKFLNVKNWVKENITKDEINQAFYELYSDLL